MEFNYNNESIVFNYSTLILSRSNVNQDLHSSKQDLIEVFFRLFAIKKARNNFRVYY